MNESLQNGHTGVRKWLPMMVLGTAMLVTVFDATLLGVAMVQLTEDFDTDIRTVQLIVTMYALTVGAFMLASGKVGDTIGRRKAYAVGAVIYAAGSALTIVAGNVWVALLGWAILKGIAASLMLPQIEALIPFNYRGKDRALAFAMIGGIGGAGSAIGLIGGGWVTSALSWRYVHAFQLVLIIGAIFGLRYVADSPPGERQRIDVVGALLSIIGLGAIVYGTLQSSQWGFIEPRDSPVEPFGFALTPFVIIGGAVVLWGFVAWQRRQEDLGRAQLLRLTLFQNPQLRGALIVGFAQAVIIGGAMFLFPMYLQVVVGEDALGTGVRLLPLSIALLVASIGAVGFAAQQSPRRIVRVGLLLMLAGLGLAMWAVDTSLRGLRFGIALAVLGLGLGVLASILGALIQGAVGDRDRSEASALSSSSSKVGNAMGTALLGAVLISGLSAAFVDNISTDGRVPSEIAVATAIELDGQVQFVPSSVVEDALNQTDLAPDEASGIIDSFETAEIQALRAALLVAMVVALIALAFTRALSGDKPDVAGEPNDAPTATTT